VYILILEEKIKSCFGKFTPFCFGCPMSLAVFFFFS
jgi:hypothetical protein